MQIPCKDIAAAIETTLQKEVEYLTNKGKKPKLVTILVGSSPEQLSYVSIKERVATKLSIGFEFIHLQIHPSFEEFKKLLKEKSNDPSVTGIIIQQPLPDNYDVTEMYAIIPYHKEIEGHKRGSVFQFPLSLAVLTGIKYVYNGNHINEQNIVKFPEDTEFFQTHLTDKRIVIAGRGATGGKPIGDALDAMNIPYDQTHSQTEAPEKLYQQADIIITATGRKILSPKMLKKEVVLLNVGLREERGYLKGDYDEKEVEPIASYYTKTPGGLGPIDVLYLYKNLIDATQLQLERNFGSE